MPTISPFLWFDDQAMEAAEFYCSVFPDSEILEVTHVLVEAPSGPGPGGVSTVRFRLNDEEFTALNGGPLFTFNESVSFVVDCDSQDEVDEVWEKLTAEGEPVQCGWLKDKFGLSWQVVPKAMYALLGSTDTEAAKRATQVMLSQVKLDIEAMQRAFDGV
jgi:predicted 3-demethylubiquinone-9 3-methyltransferase (glyoxalase superfamily)